MASNNKKQKFYYLAMLSWYSYIIGITIASEEARVISSISTNGHGINAIYILLFCLIGIFYSIKRLEKPRMGIFETIAAIGIPLYIFIVLGTCFRLGCDLAREQFLIIQETSICNPF